MPQGEQVLRTAFLDPGKGLPIYTDEVEAWIITVLSPVKEGENCSGTNYLVHVALLEVAQCA